ncbi:phospholipase D family protein [Paenalcaligenes hermetiae]|uniref:Phospholipase D family protein n=1 Tax=Paenalcaligenes hermetiae TaxID=1157987 RepID=A0ABP9M8V2_9BURK
MFHRRPLLPAFYKHRLATICASVAFISGCALPPLSERTPSQAISAEEAANTRLGQALQPLINAHPGLSGVRALPDAHDAFAVRALLIHAAEKSLDVQYYIWRADTTGMMLLQNLHNAAERGVRVRLLLDDNGIRKLDRELALLNTHPNFEVRLFNPFVIRRPKAIGYLTDFYRLNHRMHNKSFTVDNMATVVGGRNIGDEYFGATDQTLFADLDVLAFGAVVQDVSYDFDRYWASPLAYPIDQIVKLKPTDTLDDLDLGQVLKQNPDRTQRYLHVLRDTELVQELLQQRLDVEWVKTEMVSDDPIKAEGKANAKQMLSYQLHHAIGTPALQVDLISPYFVPTKTGVRGFERLRQKNIPVRILTNSYEATDVAAVHAGYIKRRKAMLRAGIEIYELKKLSSGNLNKKGKNPFGSSGSSLHAKTFAMDGERVFIGSFNFDPRSANLNTELGFVIHSPTLAQEISRLFSERIPYSSYRLALNEHNKLIWLEQEEDGSVITHTTEPGTSLFSRWWMRFMSKLPIEWML